MSSLVLKINILFVINCRQKEEELERLEKEFDKLTGAEKHLQSQVNKEQNNLGGLKRDLETNKDLIQHRNDLINKLAFDLKISGKVFLSCNNVVTVIFCSSLVMMIIMVTIRQLHSCVMLLC